MARLLVHVEGETEETFVNEVLRPHLYNHGYSSVGARLIGNARLRSHRGRIQGWPPIRNDILRHLKQDHESLHGIMVDYYALPSGGDKAWPGRQEAASKPFHDKAATIQSAIHADLVANMPRGFKPSRFIPYVMMHEFEGLLFSDCTTFANAVGRPQLAASLQKIREQFKTPEEINDSPITAPSKRIIDLMDDYQKPLFGNIGILGIGLSAIRRECPGFRQWLEELEGRARPGE